MIKLEVMQLAIYQVLMLLSTVLVKFRIVQQYLNLQDGIVTFITADNGLQQAVDEPPLQFYTEQMFQEDIKKKKFERADLNTVKLMHIPAHTTCPIRLASSTGTRHTPMAAGLKCVTTIGNLDFPMLFSQPGLVVPNHQVFEVFQDLKYFYTKLQFPWNPP